jgi:hypothetical protein
VVPGAVLGATGVDRVRALTIFVLIPGGNVIWSVAGLGIFGGYTVPDSNRLPARPSAVPIAASIFLDVLNVSPVNARAVRWRARLGDRSSRSAAPDTRELAGAYAGAELAAAGEASRSNGYE